MCEIDCEMISGLRGRGSEQAREQERRRREQRVGSKPFESRYSNCPNAQAIPVLALVRFRFHFVWGGGGSLKKKRFPAVHVRTYCCHQIVLFVWVKVELVDTRAVRTGDRVAALCRCA